uniref:Uncharacterized protein LOC104266376 n=1 Tax=Phallusia mammillata TaxID=59560 RepID=A0A6F9DJX6_9ASCI|nr:uncharacterized protein LOC104266376 [Phallusia mammillata]
MSGEIDNDVLESQEAGFGHSVGRIVLVVFDFVIFLLEVLVFCFVLKCSWSNYRETKGIQKKSFLHFLRHLPPLKSCFLASNFIILISTGLFIIRLLLPPATTTFQCSLGLKITGPTCYTTELASVYLYLWARQYYLHSSEALKSVLPKWLPVLSKISLILTIGGYLLQIIIIWVPIGGSGDVKSVYKDGACFHSASSVAIFPFVVAFATVVTQTTYVILFYVIVRSLKKANQEVNHRKSNLNWMAPRCLKLAIACIGSDCLTMLFLNIVGQYIPEIYVHPVPRIDVFINLICMLFCFNRKSELASKALSIITKNKGAPKRPLRMSSSHRTTTL